MKPSGAELNLITKMIEDGAVMPMIDRVVPFSEIQSALDYSETGRAHGKIIVTMD